MVTKPLLEAKEIRAYIDDLERKAKVANKKAANQNKKLLKAQEAFKKVDEEIEHFQLVGKVHVFEKVKFTKELKRLSEMAERVSWDAATKCWEKCHNTNHLECR